MKEVKRLEIIGFVSFILISFFYFLYTNVIPIINGNLINVSSQGWRMCFVGMIFGGGCLIATRGKNFEKIFVLYVAVIAISLIFMDKSYSMIDEAAHFDYINYIVNNHSLPTLNDYVDVYTLNSLNCSNNLLIRNYEAVQGPVYYILMAVAFGWIRNLWFRFILIRIAGLVFLLLSYLIGRKAITVLVKNDIIQNEKLYVFFLLVFLLNPGTVIRCTRVSNECLAILLSCCVAYLYLMLIVDNYDRKKAFLATGIGALLFLTKSTNVYWLGGIFLILIYYKKWKDCFSNIAIIILCVGPWFIRNLMIYGNLTGMSGHIEIVMPILNPNYEPVNLFEKAINLFGKSLFLPNENLLSTVFGDYFFGIVNCSYNIALIIVFVNTMVSLYKIIKRKMLFEYSMTEKEEMVFLLCAAEVFAFVFVLIFSTARTRIDTIIGRYMYTLAIPLVFLFGTLFERLKNMLLKKILLIHIAVAYGIAWILTVNSFGLAISAQNQITYSNPSGIEGILGNVEQGILYEQVFTANFSSIESISIMFGTYGRENECSIDLKVYEYGSNHVVGETSVSCEGFLDCAYEDIIISMYEELKPNSKYVVSITSVDSNDENCVALFRGMDALDANDAEDNFAVIDSEIQKYDIVLKIKGK